MKWSTRWWRTWGLVDILALGGGLVAALAYVRNASTPEESRLAWLNLWPNIATEVLGAWLSVRIIGTILNRREERHNLRNTLTENLNYVLGICQRLAPKFYGFNLRDLQGEITFFDEKRQLKFKLLRKHLSKEELALVTRAFGQAAIILESGRVASNAIETAASVREPADLWKADSLARELGSEFDRYRGSETANPAVLQDALGVCRAATTGRGSLGPSAKDAIERFCASIEAHLTARRACEESLSALEKDIQVFRRTVWGEI